MGSLIPFMEGSAPLGFVHRHSEKAKIGSHPYGLIPHMAADHQRVTPKNSDEASKDPGERLTHLQLSPLANGQV